MKLKLTEKKIEEVENDEDLSGHKFDQEELDARVEELDNKMHRLAAQLQEKVPEQVAHKFFSKYGSERERLQIANYVDKATGLVRIADIFISAKIYNNIDLSWHLEKYNK